MTAMPEAMPPGRPPFFVVGCGRSGTTLLRTMLNRHPKLAVPLETYCIVDYLMLSRTVSADKIWPLFPKEHEITEWGVRPPEKAATYAGPIKDRISRFHRDALLSDAGGDARWGQKTPRFVRYMELLSASWPGAQFIHVVRDPRAVANSLIRSEVHRSNPLFAAYRWRRDVGDGLAFEETHPGKVLRVKYEELIRAPEQTLRDVVAFLGIDYDPAMLEYQESAKSAYNSDYYAKVHRNLGEMPKTERIAKWRDELSDDVVALIQDLCADAMTRLGYERLEVASTRTGFLKVKCWLDRPIGFAGQARHMLTTRFGYFRSWLRRKLWFSVLRMAAALGLGSRKS